MSAQPLNATLVERLEVADSMAKFRLRLDSALAAFRPGQYVSLGVSAAAGIAQRPYSVVSLPAAGNDVELFIRRVDGGAVSPRLWQLAPGDRVRVGPAKGLFVLDENDRRTRVFVGTGTGLAPLLAMLDRLAQAGDRSPNVLIHGVANQTELGYRGRIEAWIAGGLDLWYIPSVSRPADAANADWTGTTGRADAVLEKVFAADPSLCGGTAYLCGNPQMLESVTAGLVAAGMRPDDVRSERFQAPPAAAAVTVPPPTAPALVAAA